MLMESSAPSVRPGSCQHTPNPPADTAQKLQRLRRVPRQLKRPVCCPAALTYTLMEDIVDQCTVDEAELVFAYLETRLQTLRKIHANFKKSPAKMAVLRICNQMLRR